MSSCLQLRVESRDFSQSEKEKKLLAKVQKFKNNFHSKTQHKTFFRENFFHFVNLLGFASSPFFLSLRKKSCD